MRVPCKRGSHIVAKVVWPRTSVMTRRERPKSSAVDASSPRDELSQHCTRARVVIISAILTRLRSPPDTPRTKLSPTRVFSVCVMFSILSSMSLTEALNCEREIPGKRPLGPGVLVESAKLSVWPTVRVGMWMSSETEEKALVELGSPSTTPVTHPRHCTLIHPYMSWPFPAG